MVKNTKKKTQKNQEKNKDREDAKGKTEINGSNRKIKRIRLTSEQRERFNEYATIALNIALAGAIVALALTAPNALKMFAPLKKRKWWQSEEAEEEIKVFNEKLIKDNYLKKKTKDGKQYLYITSKGRREIINFEIDDIEIKKRKWDGKWRIVIFDIPEKYRMARNVLRSKLKEIGFVIIQKSVWVCPYECEKEIAFIAKVYMIEQYVNYLRADQIDVAKSLKTRFDFI